jgi:hypothetical protein
VAQQLILQLTRQRAQLVGELIGRAVHPLWYATSA